MKQLSGFKGTIWDIFFGTFFNLRVVTFLKPWSQPVWWNVPTLSNKISQIGVFPKPSSCLVCWDWEPFGLGTQTTDCGFIKCLSFSCKIVAALISYCSWGLICSSVVARFTACCFLGFSFMVRNKREPPFVKGRGGGGTTTHLMFWG